LIGKRKAITVVKLVYIVKRRADFTPEAFYRRWLQHGPLVRSFAKAIRAKRYIQSHTIATPLNAEMAAPRGMGAPYDGITEVWWESLDDLIAASATPEGRDAMEKLIEDERQFIDLAGSHIFMTQEHVIFEGL
jgi:hypothetical protein